MRRRHYRINKQSTLLVSLAVILGIAALLAWWIVDRQPYSFSFDIASSTEAGHSRDTTPDVSIITVDRSAQSINSVVMGLREASQFKALFLSTGVASAISANGEYTLFVPTSGAFGQLPPGTIAEMTPTEKKRLVQEHVIIGHAIRIGEDPASVYLALSNDVLTFSYGLNNVPMISTAIITKAYKAKNGTVYLIDNVLLPPKKLE